MSKNDVNIPVWNGNRDLLPKLNQLFIYKGHKYLQVKLYGSLMVIDIEKERPALGMEILMRGSKSGVATADVLIKAEVGTIEEVAGAFEEDTGKALNDLLIKFAALAKQKGLKGVAKFLKEKGVTFIELCEMREILVEARLETMLETFFLS